MYIASNKMKALNQRYKKTSKNNKGQAVWIMLALVLVTAAGCKKFVEVPDPITNTSYSNVYSNDATAVSVLTGIYASLANA